MNTQQKAMQITNILIDSGLSISDQLKVIKNVQERLQFCKIVGNEINQLKMFDN